MPIGLTLGAHKDAQSGGEGGTVSAEQPPAGMPTLLELIRYFQRKQGLPLEIRPWIPCMLSEEKLRQIKVEVDGDPTLLIDSQHESIRHNVDGS